MLIGSHSDVLFVVASNRTAGCSRSVPAAPMAGILRPTAHTTWDSTHRGSDLTVSGSAAADGRQESAHQSARTRRGSRCASVDYASRMAGRPICAGNTSFVSKLLKRDRFITELLI